MTPEQQEAVEKMGAWLVALESRLALLEKRLEATCETLERLAVWIETVQASVALTSGIEVQEV